MAKENFLLLYIIQCKDLLRKGENSRNRESLRNREREASSQVENKRGRGQEREEDRKSEREEERENERERKREREREKDIKRERERERERERGGGGEQYTRTTQVRGWKRKKAMKVSLMNASPRPLLARHIRDLEFPFFPPKTQRASALYSYNQEVPNIVTSSELSNYFCGEHGRGIIILVSIRLIRGTVSDLKERGDLKRNCI